MKLTKAATALGTLVFALVLVCANAYADGAEKAYGKFCNDNDNFGLSHSTCVVCMAQGDGAAACMCRMEGLEGEEYGDCVSGAGASKLSVVVLSGLLIGAIAFKVRRRMVARPV